jgi:DNA-3-methyladenine glycosylase II
VDEIPLRLDEDSVDYACRKLAELDADMAFIYGHLGPSPLWARPQGFATLIHIILEQQVSLASAKAAFDRLCHTLDPLTPQAFLTLDDASLKTIGFSRQKTAYGRNLALAILEGKINLQLLDSKPDDEVRESLIRLKGIGVWTANIYLLMVLLRPDIWPQGDLALAGAYQKVKGLPVRPDDQELNSAAYAWRPWRSVAARLLWQYYLSKPVPRVSRDNAG